MLSPPGLSRGRGWAPVTPSDSFDFAGGVPAGLTLVRATAAVNPCNWRGYVQDVAAGAPVLLYDQHRTFNEHVNPWGDGGVLGGALPAGFNGGIGGITPTKTLVARGITSDGLPWVEIEVSGIPSNVNGATLTTNDLVAGNIISARAGETFSGWIGAQIMETTGLSGVCSLRIREYSTFALGGSTVIADGVRTTTGEVRASGTRVINNAACTNVGLEVSGGATTIGVFVRLRARIIFPVVNRGAAPLTDSVLPVQLAARIGTVPQYAYLGLLRDEATVNLHANGRLEGAVAGSPGTPPTNNGTVTGSENGLTRTVVLGAENGLSWVGYRYAGTASIAFNVLISTTTTPLVAAVPGETVTHAVYADISGATLPAAAPLLILFGWSGAPEESASTPFVAGAALAQRRTPVTLLLADPAVTSVNPLISVSIANGETVDFMVRMAAPSIEKLPYATAVMLPPVAVPGTAARDEDLLTSPNTVLDPAISSMSMRWSFAPGRAVDGTGAGMFLAVGDGTNGPASYPAANLALRFNLRDTSSNVIFSARGPLAEGQFATAAMAWGDGTGLSSWDGAPAVVDAAVTTPASYVGDIRLSSEAGGLPGCGMVVRFLRLWKGIKLSPVQVQAESGRVT